jgi:hypothetical protein
MRTPWASLGTDLCGVAGDVTFPLGPHQRVTDPSAAGDSHQRRVGLRIIGEARYPGRLLERELT